MLWFEHTFGDNTILRIVDKEFRAAKRDVPFLQFCFKDETGRNMTLETPLYDKKVNVVEEIHKGLGRYLDILPETKTLGVEDDEPEVIAPKSASELLELHDHANKNPRRCKRCGEEYMPKSPRQLYCNPCRLIREPKRPKAITTS